MTVGAFFLVAVLGVVAPEVQISTVGGESTVGRLEQISGDSVSLKSISGDASIPTQQILSITPTKPPARPDATQHPGAWIELVDGSKLTTQQFTVHQGTASIEIGKDEHIELSTAAIRLVRFSNPNDPKAAAWPADADGPAAGDRLIVHTKSGVDLMEGVIGDVTDERVEFKIDDETVPAQRAKIDGLIFFHKAGKIFPDAACIVDDASGWRLKAKTVALDNGQLEVTTLAGPQFTRSVESISRLDFSAGKLLYLSDLKPESVQWTSYFDYGGSLPAVAQFYAPHHDEGPEHLPLSLAGKTYAKGLSIYSRTELSYHIPSGIKKLKATAGIDDAVRPIGNVHLVISADGKTIFDRAVTGADAPIDLDLDVGGTHRLSILVDFGDNEDTGDYLDLADARMLK